MEFYFQNGIAGSTQRTYKSAKVRYTNFGALHGFLPTSELLLCRYCSFLVGNKLSHSTIKCYLAAMRHLHIAEGYGDPAISKMAKLEQVLKGIKSTQAKSIEKRVRLPITRELLLKLKKEWVERESSRDGTMLWAASALCFFAFLRSGEITIPSDLAYDKGAHLSFDDVKVDSLSNPKMLRVRIKASKTDPFRLGVDVYVCRTEGPLCPLEAVLKYMTVRGKGPGPLFQFQDGRPLIRVRFVAGVQEALRKAGVEYQNYSGHSFRSGGSGHHSSSAGSERSNNQYAGQVEEQCLPALYQNSQVAPGIHFSTAGGEICYEGQANYLAVRGSEWMLILCLT